MTAVVEAMTTNETFFFRDKVPFENFRTAILPALLAARREQRSIRIWSAAASTGQEPYSLAMTLKELADSLAGWRIEIIATDLATSVKHLQVATTKRRAMTPSKIHWSRN